jgi:hypothetical protein
VKFLDPVYCGVIGYNPKFRNPKGIGYNAKFCNPGAIISNYVVAGLVGSFTAWYRLACMKLPHTGWRCLLLFLWGYHRDLCDIDCAPVSQVVCCMYDITDTFFPKRGQLTVVIKSFLPMSFCNVTQTEHQYVHTRVIQATVTHERTEYFRTHASTTNILW